MLDVGTKGCRGDRDARARFIELGLVELGLVELGLRELGLDTFRFDSWCLLSVKSFTPRKAGIADWAAACAEKLDGSGGLARFSSGSANNEEHTAAKLFDSRVPIATPPVKPPPSGGTELFGTAD
jgi:hypothetical protein